MNPIAKPFILYGTYLTGQQEVIAQADTFKDALRLQDEASKRLGGTWTFTIKDITDEERNMLCN